MTRVKNWKLGSERKITPCTIILLTVYKKDTDELLKNLSGSLKKTSSQNWLLKCSRVTHCDDVEVAH